MEEPLSLRDPISAAPPSARDTEERKEKIQEVLVAVVALVVFSAILIYVLDFFFIYMGGSGVFLNAPVSRGHDPSEL